MRLVNIGFGNLINADRLIAIVSPESAPIKRMVQESKEKGTLIDATQGHRTKSVIITDNDHIVLSYLLASTLSDRLLNEELSEMEDNHDE